MSTPFHVLFISYDGMTDPLGQSQVIPYMQGMRQAGYDITILSCEKPALYTQRRAAIQQILDDAGIAWVPLKYSKQPPVLSSMYDLYKLKRAAARIHLAKRVHIAHTRAGTPAMVGNWLKVKYGIKFLNDLRDFFADSRVDSGAWNQQSLLYRSVYRYFKKAEAEQLRNSDGIVCLTHAAKDIIRSWPAYRPSVPLTVIPCSVDLDLFNPTRIDAGALKALRNKHQIADTDFILTYLGSIGGWYLVAEMMQFFKRLLVTVPNAKFLFISPHQHEYILQVAAKYGVHADKLISVKGNRPEIPLLLSLSSYSIFFIKPCYSKQASSPTKHGEIMAMGVPVITNSGVGDVASIVKKYISGIVLDDFSQESFDKATASMAEIAYNQDEIRQGAKEFYALPKAVESYAAMYRSILGTTHHQDY
ncbi:MAG: glycosyltransferase [Chitinophagaceae bacterium]|nr:MAG: glycosyltransferase [Chitinophagaceae bacterium]